MFKNHVAGQIHGDLSDSEAMVYMNFHTLYGLGMAAGALCRLLDKRSEACFFFFLTAWTTPMSTKWHSQYFTNLFMNEHFPDFPVHRVISTVTFATAAFMFSIHVATMAALRRLLDENDNHQDMTGYDTLAFKEDNEMVMTKLTDDDSEEETST